MRIRIRGPDGVSTITLAETASVGDLRKQIISSSGIRSFTVKRGYPPESLELDAYADNIQLAEAGLRLNGEQLIITKRALGDQTSPLPSGGGLYQAASVTNPPSKNPTLSQGAAQSFRTKHEDDAPEVPIPSKRATMMLRVMPSDNSCLFRAFSYVMFGPGIDSMHELRSLVASTIQSDPDKYSDAILGKPRQEYCKWIQTEYSWGGYVELIILAENFQIGVASINVQDGRVDFYNESSPMRCFLVYSGIHYDVIAVSPTSLTSITGKAAPDEDVKMFARDDQTILASASDLCKILRERNYHVDVSAIRTEKLKCLECGWSGDGMDEVSKHVSETGHTRLSQT